jgi:hypothetical protein
VGLLWQKHLSSVSATSGGGLLGDAEDEELAAPPVSDDAFLLFFFLGGMEGKGKGQPLYTQRRESLSG